MDVSISGSEELQELLRGAFGRLREDLPPVMQDEVNAIAIDARTAHGFTTRTGNLENSIEPTVDARNLTASVSLNPDRTSPQGFDYGRAIHNGTRYIAPDPFLKNAAERRQETTINNIAEAAWRSLTRET